MTAESDRTRRSDSFASFDDEPAAPRRPNPLPRTRDPRVPPVPPPLPLLPDGLSSQLANFLAAIGDFGHEFGAGDDEDQRQDLLLKVLDALFHGNGEGSVAADVVTRLGEWYRRWCLDGVVRQTTRGALRGYPSDNASPRSSEEMRQRAWWAAFQAFLVQLVDGEGARALRAGDVDEVAFVFGSMWLEDNRVQEVLASVTEREGVPTPGQVRLLRRLISAITGVCQTVAKYIWK
ncbi:hypothetical protein Q8F55_001804 [Vanrija albida]|uniref:Uncharacterized protein n=1 Tax=Vanrija albida TaxID=181172 RepID=A0ABR3Q7Z3_9TREE